ncbi:hypothetical protein DMUE_2185, partial [Dictyocoela muelleri]
MGMQQKRLHCILKNNRGKYPGNRNLPYSFKRRNKIQYGLTPKKGTNKITYFNRVFKECCLGCFERQPTLASTFKSKKMNDLVTITRKNHNYTTIKDYDIPSEL